MSTVAAVSTPRGKGGVAMIRISGEDAFGVASRVFAPVSPAAFSAPVRGKAYYGSFFDKDGVFDDGLCTLFRSPSSFTGENVAELCCHGGLLVTQKLLSAVFAAGADPAGPGEFTKRAFINGKLSLTGAEAIAGIIDAESEKYLSVSAKQASGSLSRLISGCADKLRFLAASVYAFIDYPDEDMTDVTPDEMKNILLSVRGELDKLAKSRSYGKAISEGIRTAIVGRPNVGKSSVLNMLCGEERAIVTGVAGTTRDVITETVRLGDYVLRLSDTAGIRESGDEIERLGVQRSLVAIDEAELILLVLDCASPLTPDDEKIIDSVKKAGKEECTVCLLNKSDIAPPVFEAPFRNSAVISASEKSGVGEIEKLVSKLVGAEQIGENDEIITNARQYAAITKAIGALDDAIKTLHEYSQDVAGMDIERALSALYEADGRTVGEEIVNEIFSHFCVGK